MYFRLGFIAENKRKKEGKEMGWVVGAVIYEAKL